MTQQFANFTYTYCRFHFNVTEPLELPAFIGGLLRGKFGEALKNNQHCIGAANNCVDCMYKQYCTYFKIFENEADNNSPDPGKYLKQPRPYIFKAPMTYKSYYAAGETLAFDMVLLGKGIDFLNDIITALQKIGANKGNNTMQLVNIEYLQGTENARSVFGKQLKVLHFASEPTNNNMSKIEVKFVAPVRLKEKGAEASNISLELLLNRIQLRAGLLDTIFCNGSSLPYNIDTHNIRYTTQLHRFEQKRYSHRNHRQTEAGGLLGSLFLEGDLQNILTVLKMGELLHVGKYASFGMGQFEVVEGGWKG